MATSLTSDFIDAVRTNEQVIGLTHGFYRYPARFSPLFARAAIEAFTQPGQLVYDPFMGSGTTLVEASTLGRRAVGTDISSLAYFLADVKTTPLEAEDIAKVSEWARSLLPKLNLRRTVERATTWREMGYQKNISDRATWRVRKILELALAEVPSLSMEKQRKFARCIWLKTAQWALDCRYHLPSSSEVRERFLLDAGQMLHAAGEYAEAVKKANEIGGGKPAFRTLCLQRSAAGIETESFWTGEPAPALILTSPPYPGLHVLYHRWQVRGRRETAAPFWIADSLDGNGGAFYTMGGRHSKTFATYFGQVRDCFVSLARIADDRTLVVQMVGFSNPSWQLPRYLEVMEEAGFEETCGFELKDSPDGRLWREVPNRKWYAHKPDSTAGSKEVVLFHRKRTVASLPPS